MSILITSFGYLHGPVPAEPPPALVLDMRNLVRDPHVDPAMVELTGLDEAVRTKVTATPGFGWLLRGLLDLCDSIRQHSSDDVAHIAIGCAGGRHRSVVMATLLGAGLEGLDYVPTVEHRDVTKPVVQRRP